MLQIEGLSIAYVTDRGVTSALKDVDLRLNPGEIVGLLGESGCGKSTLIRSIVGTLPQYQARIEAGSIKLDGVDMLAGGDGARHIRGRKITFVPQDHLQSFNPLFRVGTLMTDLMRFSHPGNFGVWSSRRQRTLKQEALSALESVQISDPETVFLQYPHQLSGGQRQRVMLALALLPNPRVIVADEPTASLDASTQLHILKLFKRVAKERGIAIMFSTHILAAAWEICDRIVVLREGQVVEDTTSDEFFLHPTQPYSKRLLSAALQSTLAVNRSKDEA